MNVTISFPFFSIIALQEWKFAWQVRYLGQQQFSGNRICHIDTDGRQLVIYDNIQSRVCSSIASPLSRSYSLDGTILKFCLESSPPRILQIYYFPWVVLGPARPHVAQCLICPILSRWPSFCISLLAQPDLSHRWVHLSSVQHLNKLIYAAICLLKFLLHQVVGLVQRCCLCMDSALGNTFNVGCLLSAGEFTVSSLMDFLNSPSQALLYERSEICHSRGAPARMDGEENLLWDASILLNCPFANLHANR